MFIVLLLVWSGAASILDPVVCGLVSEGKAFCLCLGRQRVLSALRKAECLVCFQETDLRCSLSGNEALHSGYKALNVCFWEMKLCTQEIEH